MLAICGINDGWNLENRIWGCTIMLIIKVLPSSLRHFKDFRHPRGTKWRVEMRRHRHQTKASVLNAFHFFLLDEDLRITQELPDNQFLRALVLGIVSLDGLAPNASCCQCGSSGDVEISWFDSWCAKHTDIDLMHSISSCLILPPKNIHIVRQSCPSISWGCCLWILNLSSRTHSRKGNIKLEEQVTQRVLTKAPLAEPLFPMSRKFDNMFSSLSIAHDVLGMEMASRIRMKGRM